MRPRLLIAPDKFKGTFTASEVAAALDHALSRSCTTVLRPIADGGEGTAAVFVEAGLAAWRHAATVDAAARTCTVAYALSHDRRTAWIESAACIGLSQLPSALRDPLLTSSFGLAAVVRDAVTAGAEEVFLGLGGTATNDLGCGFAAGMGWVFRDASGRTLKPIGENLIEIASIEPPAHRLPFRLVALTDVRNPLTGPNGAARAFAAQKGAKENGIIRLEEGALTIAALLPETPSNLPGSGAAGGLGFGVTAFFGGMLRPGFDTIANTLDLAAAVAASDVVVTAEGRFDETSLLGKGPAGVARMAREAGKPCVLLCGSCTDSARTVFDAVFPLVEGEISDTPVRDEAALNAAAEKAATWIDGLSQPPAGRSR